MMQTRTKKALVTLGVGLALNILLGAAKLTAGLMSDATSVISDGANNFSDAAVSVVTLIATFLAARGADKEHPFGHGRYEYIATFILGAVIVVVGGEVLINGIKRCVTPVDIETGALLFAVLGGSVGVKLFMAVFYAVRGRATGSDTIRAAAVDSASDSAVTSAVLVCALIQKYTGARIDGYAAVAISAVILVLAVKILKQTINRLLGERPDPELYDSVIHILTAHPAVKSVHDVIINDYGENNKIAEADAVFPADMEFVEVHSVCDKLEREVREKTGIKLCLHADPLITSDERVVSISALLADTLSSLGATAHDIFIDDENKKVKLDIKLSDGAADTISAQAEALIRSVVQYDVEIGIDYI